VKVLIFHSPRTGSNLLCNLLHQTGIAGCKSYEHCGFPLGSIGTITKEEFPTKLAEYEASQTTENGVFSCKLSWEGLINLANQIGIAPVYGWLSTIDHHIYLYRHDVIAQAVSFYIAGKRSYFSTLKLDRGEIILPTPEYSYDEIAYRRMLIERHRAEMETYFEDYCINPLRISYEAFTYNDASMQDTLQTIMSHLGLDCATIGEIKPQIRKQLNMAKDAYKDRFLLEWADRNDSLS
jgi:LPS sulfotransferase NodH